MEPAVLAAVAATATLGTGMLLIPQGPAPRRVALAFPPDLGAEQVELLLGAIAGLPARARIVSQIEGTAGRLAFAIEAVDADLRTIQGALQGVAPGVRFEDSIAEAVGPPSLRAWLGWRGSHVLLRRDQPELAVSALLGVLRQTSQRERLRLRVRLRPVVRPKAPPYPRGAPRAARSSLLSNAPLPTDQVRAVRQQYAGPLLNARIELLVWAPSVTRARHLLARVVAILRARSGARGRFTARQRWVFIPSPGTMLAPAELVSLLAWPLQGPDLPGLSFVRAPRRLPDPAIPSQNGRCYGTSTWPGMEQREMHQPVVGALSHGLIVGPTGTGKSALLTRLLLDDVAAGRGALLLDLKGDTALDVLARIPEHRHRDVVVLDPADRRPVPGLKSLHSSTADLTADLWVGLFRQLYADSFGIRSERYIRLGVQTLARSRSVAITELGRVFHDVRFRRRLLMGADPLLLNAWASFEQMSAAQRAEHIGPALGRVEDVVGRRVVRGVLGQTAPKMTIARAMRERKIVLVRLSPGQLGGPTAQLLGALVVYEIYQAVMARQALPPAARAPFAVLVDEPAVMGLSSVPLDSLYELARGMRVSITTATQSVEQLPQRVQRALLTNAATIAAFRTGARDARLIAAELPGIDAEQVQHLGQYEIALRLGLEHGRVSSVATARTLPLPESNADADRLRDESAARYGAAIEDTDAALRARWSDAPDGANDVPIGRRRRS